MAKGSKPGKAAPISGQYKPAGGGNEITAIKGKPLPPGPRKGISWVPVDATKNKSGRP